MYIMFIQWYSWHKLLYLQVLHNPYFAITSFPLLCYYCKIRRSAELYQKLKLRIANSFLTNILPIENSLLQDIPTFKNNFLPINEIQRLNPLNLLDRLHPNIPLGTRIPT